MPASSSGLILSQAGIVNDATIGGIIDAVTIGGDVPGASFDSGQISATNGLGNVMIDGSLIGGAGQQSGDITVSNSGSIGGVFIGPERGRGRLMATS